MDETTTVQTADEETLTSDDISGAFDTIIGVFSFFQNIIDTIAGVIQPLLESLLSSIGYYDN